MNDTANADLALAAARFDDTGAQLFIDISTLLEDHWTGIPMVAAGLADALDSVFGDKLAYFCGTDLISPRALRDARARKSGVFLNRDIATGDARLEPIPPPTPGRARVALFPSVKTLRHGFDIEALVVHDVSTLVTPQFHIHGNVAHHMDAIIGDIASSDLVCAVSAATRADLIAYFGIDPARVIVVPNGVSTPAHIKIAADSLAPDGKVEPYIVILGTREPRKNVSLVFDMLARFPDMLRTHRYVFVGRLGWLEEHHMLPKALQPHQAAGRIVFTGFVTESQKYTLLHHAAASLYPSLFEGFGLPVLESLAAGTPCVASFSSSIPEVSGGPACLFDPLSTTDLQRAIGEILRRRQVMGAAAIRDACLAQAAPFTWPAAATRILNALTPLAAGWNSGKKRKARGVVRSTHLRDAPRPR